MNIVAFDLGTNYACVHNGICDVVCTEHGVVDGKRPEKLKQFKAYLHHRFSELLATCGRIDTVIYERPFARGLAATRLLWGMAGILEAEAEDAGLPIIDMPPTTIKKFATGSGKAQKPDMLAAAKKMGYCGSNEHEADAFCLLKYAEANVTKGSNDG